MNNHSFSFDEKNSSAHWLNNGFPVCVETVKQACIDGSRDFVATLPMRASQNSVNLYNLSGELLFSAIPPDGYIVEYLISDDSHGVRVVCSNQSAGGDLLDWYFKIDLSKKIMVKQGRAY